MTALRPRDKMALGGIAAVLVVVAFYFLVFNPQVSKVSSLNSQIATQKATLSQDQTTYQQGRAAEISLHMNRAKWAAVRRAVPVSADIPGLLRLLQNNSNAAKVTLSSVTMTGYDGAASSVGSPDTSTTSTTTGSTAVPESLVFKGSYQSIEQLARQLDHLVVIDRSNEVRSEGPLVTISSVEVDSGSGQYNPAALNATLTANIYEQPQAQTSTTSTTLATSTTAGGTS